MTRCRAGLTIQEMDYGLAIQVEDKRCRAQNISQREKMCRRKLHLENFKSVFIPLLFFTALRLSDTGCKGLGGDEEDVLEGPCPSHKI